jgi:hypothetical protein
VTAQPRSMRRRSGAAARCSRFRTSASIALVELAEGRRIVQRQTGRSRVLSGCLAHDHLF